jgi:hypothetical protein
MGWTIGVGVRGVDQNVYGVRVPFDRLRVFDG